MKTNDQIGLTYSLAKKAVAILDPSGFAAREAAKKHAQERYERDLDLKEMLSQKLGKNVDNIDSSEDSDRKKVEEKAEKEDNTVE